MLTRAAIEQILAQLPRLTVGVLGDLFLDRYLDIDAALTEPSIETGLDAYQVVRVRSYPGAAGTVINNLVALGVGQVYPISVIGDDGEGYELRQALAEQRGVELRWTITAPERRTPTYTKPMLHQADRSARELNRLDIKNRSPLPDAAQEQLLHALADAWPQVDALIVLDQVSEAECGVVTSRVRERLAECGEANPERLILADSRERIGRFRSVSLKLNLRECELALRERGIVTVLSGGGLSPVRLMSAEQMFRAFVERSARPIFCTLSEYGIYLARGQTESLEVSHVPAYPVDGPIDPVGAGDSTSAGIACALAAGASLEQAAAFGCLVASITIQQIGVTGAASPEQVRQTWQEVSGA